MDETQLHGFISSTINSSASWLNDPAISCATPSQLLLMEEDLLNHPLFEPLSKLFRFITVGDTDIEHLIRSLQTVNANLQDQRDNWISTYGDEAEKHLEALFHYILELVIKFLTDEITPKVRGLTIPEASEMRSLKRRPNFPKSVSNRLDQWLGDHADHPYPNNEEKIQLCTELGLTIKQLEDWFSNARRRKLPNK